MCEKIKCSVKYRPRINRTLIQLIFTAIFQNGLIRLYERIKIPTQMYDVRSVSWIGFFVKSWTRDP